MVALFRHADRTPKQVILTCESSLKLLETQVKDNKQTDSRFL